MIEKVLELENSWAQGYIGDWCMLRPVTPLQNSQSSLPSIRNYESQAELLGYSDALNVEIVQEESAAHIMPY